MSSTSRQLSLAPHVRSVAAIAESGERSGPSTPTDDVRLPGAIHTPQGDRVAKALRIRDVERSFNSPDSDAESHTAPYAFTLVDLNARSYFLIHEVPEMGARTESQQVNDLRDAVREAVLLANVEVCIIRCCQMAGRPSSSCVDLTSLEPSEPADAQADARRAVENSRALAPVESLLSKHLHACTHRDVATLLDNRIQRAKELLRTCGDELVTFEDVLHELAFTFAAYQPAVLDEEVKGSMSPYDPRSHTSCIREVRKLVEESVRKAETHTPKEMARLAEQLLECVRAHKPNSKLAARLLQAAFMSGHSELVDKLLDGRRALLFELDIIKRLRTAWLGYNHYKPLQATRSGAQSQTIDWLDFKYSCARAVVMAHRVIETLILRNDKDLTQSVQMAAVATSVASAQLEALLPPPPLAPPPPAPPPPPPDAEPSFRDSVAPAAGGSAAIAAAAATANGDEGGGEAEADRPMDSRSRKVSVSAPSVPPAPFSSWARGLLDDSSGHVELEPTKWELVRELFPRPAACKPLALAMLHVVLAGKREVQRVRQAAANTGAAGEGAGASPPPTPFTSGGGRGGSDAGESELALPGEGEGAPSEGDEEQAEVEAAERARQAEEARTARYRRLHLLAVQACHLAVHSSSLSTVSDAIACIRAVRAWPAIDLVMLNDLADAFPVQCAALLNAIPLTEVDLEDNVLPFRLPGGFTTVAVSDQDATEFRQGGATGSTQDAEHFATQREADASIEASLLVLGRTWLALMFLFWPSEFRSPTTRQLLRVLRGAVAAFVWQGPGSIAVAVVFGLLLLLTGVVTRVVVALVRIIFYGILHRIWAAAATRFPALRRVVSRIRGRPAAAGNGPNSRLVTMRSSAAAAARAAAGEDGGGPRRGGSSSGGGAPAADDGEEEEEPAHGLTRHLGMGLWRTFFAHGHHALIDRAVGWGKGSTSISCRKVPMPVAYRSAAGSAPGAVGVRQLDTALLEKLLRAPGLGPAVFGSKVLRALILFKWNYFTRYFIILQFLLHVTYMSVFLAYAFSIKDMEPVDGRESGPGADTPGCRLQAPSTTQTVLLIVLAVMTVDFLVQEIRQIRHFGLLFLTHTWDLLDVASVSLVVASVTLHFSCTSDVSPLTLRGLAAVQIVLLFMRLLYYAMASDKLGSFVRMVLETTNDLFMFFAFLSVVFVGFALAIIISQGALADEEQTFIKLFTMMYGDFDVTFLSTLDSGALGLDALTRVLASIYMILVTIVLLNLLISIISESYERIRENEKWESLRNKALLVVESETQLYQFFLTWLYTTLTPPSVTPNSDTPDNNTRYLYVIAPEYARNAPGPEDDDDNEDDEEEGGNDEDGDDGQWNGRLGEIKRHITASTRATVDSVRKEVHKVLALVHGSSEKAAATNAASASASVAPGDSDVPPNGGQQATVGHATAAVHATDASALEERTVQLLTTHLGALLSREIGALRQELLAEVARAAAPAHQQHPSGHAATRLSPIAGATAAMASLPQLSPTASKRTLPDAASPTAAASVSRSASIHVRHEASGAKDSDTPAPVL